MDSAKARLLDWLRAVRPRGWLALLVLAHLVLALLQAWRLPALVERLLGSTSYWGVPTLLSAASEAVLQAQLALVAAYLTLGSGWWLVRLVRGPALLLWLLLAYLTGSMWLDGGRDLRGFQESLGAYFWTFCLLAQPMLLYRLAARRQVALDQEPRQRGRIQFRILHLLLIMTEAAAVMAAIRALVPWERDWREQLSYSLRNYLLEYASYEMLSLAILSTVPAVIVTVRLDSLRKGAATLAVWECVLSLGFCVYAVSVNPTVQAGWVENPNLTVAERIGGYAVGWLHTAVFCVTAALIVWTTLAVVRWRGYRLLPLPGRGGRQSSEATSSA